MIYSRTVRCFELNAAELNPSFKCLFTKPGCYLLPNNVIFRTAKEILAAKIRGHNLMKTNQMSSTKNDQLVKLDFAGRLQIVVSRHITKLDRIGPKVVLCYYNWQFSSRFPIPLVQLAQPVKKQLI